jgi:hypothetical protein
MRVYSPAFVSVLNNDIPLMGISMKRPSQRPSQALVAMTTRSLGEYAFRFWADRPRNANGTASTHKLIQRDGHAGYLRFRYIGIWMGAFVSRDLHHYQ